MTKARYIARPIHTSGAPRTSPRESDKQKPQISKEELGKITPRLTDPKKESCKSAKLQASILMHLSHTYPGAHITAILKREKPPGDPQSTSSSVKPPPKPPPAKHTSNDDSDDDFASSRPAGLKPRAKGTNVQCHSQTNTVHSLSSQTKAQAGRRLRRRFCSHKTQSKWRRQC